MKPYQERLVTMLKDTITLLCRNGLEYEQEFCVEGLLGVTLDKNDVFLVPIKELITDKGSAAAALAQGDEGGHSKVSDSDADGSSNTSHVKSERSRKRKHHRREISLDMGETNVQDSTAVFDTGPPEWDEDVSASISNRMHSKDKTSDTIPSKRPKPKQETSDSIKSEDVVLIKEEVDDEEFASAFHDNSVDSSAHGQDGQMTFFSEPGTSTQGQMGFQLDQLQGNVPPGLPGDLQNMTADGDNSWLNQSGDNLQATQDWQQQKHQCAVCGKQFVNLFLLKRHVEGVHLQVRHTCDICGNTYSQRDNLHRHKKAAHGALWRNVHTPP